MRPEVVFTYDERKQAEIEKEIKAQLFLNKKGEILHPPCIFVIFSFIPELSARIMRWPL